MKHTPLPELNVAVSESLRLTEFVEQVYFPFAQEKKRSWKAERRSVELHMLPYLGEYRLCDITAAKLLNWVEELGLAGLSYSSRFRLFWMLKSILNCAVRWKFLSTDAAYKEANLPAQPGRQPILLDSAEITRLIKILKNFRQRTAANAIHLMLLTGATKSEVLYARWDDVDLKNGTLSTDKTFTARPRLIPLNTEAIKLIKSLHRHDDVPWLFFTRNGTRMQSITREWYEIREMFGRNDLRLQDLRHSFANFLVSIGISKTELCTIMGHYKPETLALVRNNSLENKVRV